MSTPTKRPAPSARERSKAKPRKARRLIPPFFGFVWALDQWLLTTLVKVAV
jgi:hypothetical protein